MPQRPSEHSITWSPAAATPGPGDVDHRFALGLPRQVNNALRLIVAQRHDAGERLLQLAEGSQVRDQPPPRTGYRRASRRNAPNRPWFLHEHAGRPAWCGGVEQRARSAQPPSAGGSSRQDAASIQGSLGILPGESGPLLLELGASVCSDICEAISPSGCSAHAVGDTNRPVPRVAVAQRSSSFSLPPRRSDLVDGNRMDGDSRASACRGGGAAARAASFDSCSGGRTDVLELQRDARLLRRSAARSRGQFLLQREHALRPRPAGRATCTTRSPRSGCPGRLRSRDSDRFSRSFSMPLRRVVERIALHAGVDAGADGVDVGPRARRLPSRRVHLGRGEAGRVHRADEVAFLDSTSRAAPKSSITALLSLVMKMLAGLMSRCSILCWCTMRRPRRISSNRLRMVIRETPCRVLEVARGDDEVLQRVALQVVHHHVDRLVLAEKFSTRPRSGG